MPHALKFISLLLLGLSSINFSFAFVNAPSPIVFKKTSTPKSFSRVQNQHFTTFKQIQTLHGMDLASEASGNDEKSAVRAQLRKLTGFSLTAFRLSAQATTMSVRTALRTATGVSISNVLSAFVGMFPLWARLFMQPFLIIYYTPLMILRGLVGSTKDSRREASRSHEVFVQGWKDAVEIAEKVNEDGYWPVHVNESGGIDFKSLPDPDEVLKTLEYANAIVESVEVATLANEEKSTES